jgi:uncharacterized membrane protein YhfC
MMFIILSIFAGFVLTVVPVYLWKRFSAKWKMPKGLFLKAGLSLLVLEIFHISVRESALSYWPGFFDINLFLQALILGIMSGLFFELGRFFVLDKIFKKVRSYKEGVYFAMGWSGVVSTATGIIIIAGAIVIYLIMNTSDISTIFPQASENELKQIMDYQKQALEMNPLFGLAPIVERFAFLALDIFLTLVILSGFGRGVVQYVWLSVFFRAIFVVVLFVVSQLGELAMVSAFIVFGALLFYLVWKMKEKGFLGMMDQNKKN